MKTIKLLSLMATAALLITSCSDDDDAGPEEINEEEVITTMHVTLTPQQGDTITLQSQDLDGDGPDAPVITVSGNLAANTTYEGEIELLNETESPAEDITEEVEEEGLDHQFVFVSTGSIATVDYDDVDAGGNPVGLEFILTTGDAGDATLAITLRHEPTKPNDGTLSGAGGETDFAQTFPLIVE